MTCAFGLQVSTDVSPCAGNEPAPRRLHYHPELPTASQSLLQLYHHKLQEDLGPKAVRANILLGCLGKEVKAWVDGLQQENPHIPRNCI